MHAPSSLVAMRAHARAAAPRRRARAAGAPGAARSPSCWRWRRWCRPRPRERGRRAAPRRRWSRIAPRARARCGAPTALRGAGVPDRRERRSPWPPSSRPGALPLVVELGVAFDLVLLIARGGGLPAPDPRGVRHQRHRAPAGRCVTDLVAVLVLVAPLAPACGGALAVLAWRRRAAADRDRPRRRIATAAAALALPLARRAGARRRAPLTGLVVAASTRRGAVFLALDRGRRRGSAARSRPPTCAPPAARAPARSGRAPVYYVAFLALLGGAARGAARRQPRRRLDPARGDDRRLGAARRVQRQARARWRPGGSTSC